MDKKKQRKNEIKEIPENLFITLSKRELMNRSRIKLKIRYLLEDEKCATLAKRVTKISTHKMNPITPLSIQNCKN
jgi:hypothetical protein